MYLTTGLKDVLFVQVYGTTQHKLHANKSKKVCCFNTEPQKGNSFLISVASNSVYSNKHLHLLNQTSYIQLQTSNKYGNKMGHVCESHFPLFHHLIRGDHFLTYYQMDLPWNISNKDYALNVLVMEY